jgi:putative hydrolase of the HAD superfamily
MRRPTPVVLDLWNTLAHHPDGTNPLERLGRALGVSRRPGWVRTLAGVSMVRAYASLEEALPDIEKAFGLDADRSRRGRAVDAWSDADASAALFPDVGPALRTLRDRGHPLALLSNTQSFDLSVLHRTGLANLLDVIHLSCDTGVLKPAPEAFHGVVEALGASASETLMVGDSHVDDVQGARAAGLNAILLRRSVAPRAPRRRSVHRGSRRAGRAAGPGRPARFRRDGLTAFRLGTTATSGACRRRR